MVRVHNHNRINRLSPNQPRRFGLFVLIIVLCLCFYNVELSYARAVTKAPQEEVIIADRTPPTTPVVIDDGQYTNSHTQLHASWSSADPETGISEYQYSIGTTPDSRDIIDWTSANLNTVVTVTGLNLVENQIYYFKVKAKNTANLWSSVGMSDGILTDFTAPLINNLTPADGSIIAEGNPTIGANYSDTPGHADTVNVSINNINLFLNNENVTNLCTVTASSISYTPAQPLEDQSYAVKVTALDLAGNQSQIIWNFIVYRGSLIIPELGGEVSSPDGKAKVIIPPGALSTPTQIRILTLGQEFLNTTNPQGYTLISGAECHPLGQSFNSPVELIFKDRPHIPGTQVELGVYQSSTGHFATTGQTSVVGIDSYTISFTVGDFDTYSGMMALDMQGTPIGGGVDIPLPDMFTGAFSHTISITVPPGRKGMQPNLKLQYKSSNPNSWVGHGWSLSPGYIIRSTKNGPPAYDDLLDTFIFVSDSGATELTHLTGNLYQAKIESTFAKFFKESDDYWKILQKDGAYLELGKTADSKENNGNNTFAWYVTKVVDNNSNYIEYQYIKDGGKSYLYQVKYTGNDAQSVLPKYKVEFLLEERDDIISSYLSGFNITTAKRLDKVSSWIIGETNPVWEYDLGYEDSPDTDRSLLKTFTQFASDGQSFPTQTFNYQTAE